MRSLRVVLACGLAVGLAGCDTRSETSKKVDDASNTLNAMTGGGSSPAPATMREKTYSALPGALGASADAGEGEKAAAQLLIASAQSGLGDLSAASAGEVEGKVRRMIVSLQNDLSQWNAANAIKSAAESFDAGRELSELAASAQVKDKLIEDESKRKADLEARLTAMLDQAKQRATAAEAKLAEARGMMEQASKMSAVDGTPLVERAVAIRRQGETLRLEGENFKAKHDTMAPTLGEVVAIIEKLKNQKADLGTIEASVRARGAAARQEATDAGKMASEAAAKLGQRLAELDALRTGDLAKEYDKAIASYGKALAAAKAAQGGGKPAAGKLATGSASLSLAQAHWSRAAGDQTYGSLLATLAATRPALPNASEIDAKLKATLDHMKQELTAAQAELTAAKSAFSSSGVGGASRERLEALGAIIDKAIEVTKDDKLDAGAQFGIPSRVVPLTPMAAPAGSAAAPAATPAAAPAANHDADIAAVRAELTKLLPDPAKQAAHLAKLDAGSKAKFGKTFAEVLAADPELAPAAEMLQKATTVDASKLDVEIKGESANVTLPGVPFPLGFNKTEDGWKLGNPMMGMMIKRGAQLSEKAQDAWLADVEAGKFADIAAAAAGFKTRMGEMQQQLMQGLMGDGK